MLSKYWENESPVVVETGRNVIRYFEEAGKLQISNPYWTDEDGNKKPGKTVTLDLTAVQKNPEAVAVFKRIAETAAAAGTAST